MILFKCDRCGKLMKNALTDLFTVDVTPPEIRLLKHPSGRVHFCEDCMDKIVECVKELGRAEDE